MYNKNDGLFHWRCQRRHTYRDYDEVVLSFDMSTELFHVTPMPDKYNEYALMPDRWKECNFALLRDSLALICSFFDWPYPDDEGRTTVEVWVMKDFDCMGEAGESLSSYTTYSYSHELTLEPRLPGPCVSTCFWNKNELLIWKDVVERGELEDPRSCMTLLPNRLGMWRFLICRALAYIHNCIGLCHLDIKPQNLLDAVLIRAWCPAFVSNRYILSATSTKLDRRRKLSSTTQERQGGGYVWVDKVRGGFVLKGAQACLLTGVGGECVFHPSEFYPAWTMETASDSLKTVLQVCSGWQSLARPPEQGAVA
ncbi:hypothetical protein Vadar_009359 [Vaccinium darrowii]|uniref:Uncharacterized protein n=1 Tax=Vaccinium darrowii TaxID=229202 RepID=A0ACB7WZ34_9ERIC|nr:hypothetical protein Vadar_009359 [Vaccinium darrowii]